MARPGTGACAVAAVPVLAFAAYSLAHGGMALPNSVLMKSGPGRFDTVAGGIAAVLSDWFAVGPSLPALRNWRWSSQYCWRLAFARAGDARHESRAGSWRHLRRRRLLHASLVKMEWFFRYEAYVVLLGVIAFAPS